MTLTFKFEDLVTYSSDEIQKRAKELQNIIEIEAKKHFKDSKGPVTIAGKWSAENGDFVEVNLLTEDFVRDLEKAKNIMYSEQKRFIEDFISDVQEYETRLRIVNAIKENQFEMLYQPQFHSNENIYGFESLIRLKVDGEYISTQYFINVAEKNNLIFDIDRFVIDKATKDWSKTVRGSRKDLIVSVNVSGKHLIAPGFLEEVIGTLAKNSFPPKNLCIEITEGAFVKSVVLAKEVINKLKLTGIKIALDDFGTKYSSLKYLQEFTTNHLKIEKSFTDTIKMDSPDNNIHNIIINIAHILKCEVIAEGVETEDQLTYLRKHGCDIIQGYYYSKPLPFENAVTCI